MTEFKYLFSSFLVLAVAAALATVSASDLAAKEKSKQRVYTYPPEVEEQCSDDYFRHCSPYALGSTELRRCMEAKGGDLEPNCRQALKDAGYVRSSRR